MKKFICIASACILMAGCSTLNQGWKNFNAYYNTFYNTKQFYGEGLKKVQLQQPDINPAQMSAIFYEPNNAGSQDFELAIQRGSSILRSHEDSKYVLPAISIIGKSYFYRSEFFAALEKFRELQILGDDYWLQEGVFWEGLTYFELGNYNEGIRFLESELPVIRHPDRNVFAETHALLGQLYSARGEWSVAAEHLQMAVEEAENRETLARIYFLLGQVNEEAGEYNNALYAFARSGEISNSFNLQYNSHRKEAESARRIEAYPRALAIYTEMLRDDKYFEYRNELRYEIGRTRQSYGLIEEALENYHSVLNNRQQPATSTNRARTFFAIAEIHRHELNDYAMAAAYFDSAAAAGENAQMLGSAFNADEMAGIFGQYVLTKREISSADSLLQLAEMDEEEFEAFVEALRREEAQKIEEELQEMQVQRNRMLVADVQDTVLEAATSTEHGFLNINNQVNLADASMQFQAVWGDRPPGDNWRRRSDISGSRFDRPVEAEAADGTILQLEPDQEFGIVPQIDVGDVPFTEEQKESVRMNRENANYRLGNIFFLSLNEPDSASVYFQSVVESGYDERLKGMAAYSLAEIALLNEDTERARVWYDQLKEQSPGSVYVNRLAARLDSTPETLNEISADERILQEYFRLEERRGDQEMVSPEAVATLAHLSSDPEQRARLLFETAREYMKAARFEFTNESILTDWFERKQVSRTAESDIQDSLSDLYSLSVPDLQGNPDLLPAGIDSLGLLPAGVDSLGLLPAGVDSLSQMPAGVDSGGLLPAGEDSLGLLPAGVDGLDRVAASVDSLGLLPAGRDSADRLAAGEDSLSQMPVGVDSGEHQLAYTDTTHTVGLLDPQFPFEGAYWDSTRLYLTNVIENYPDAAVRDQAERLYTLLEIPSEEEEPYGEEELYDMEEEFHQDNGQPDSDESDQQYPADVNGVGEIPQCSDFGLEVDSEGGLYGFLDRVAFPAWTQNLSMRGEVTYHFTVAADGSLTDYEQTGSMERSGIPQAIEQALDESFYFTAHSQGEMVECSFIFPIDL